MSLAQLKQTFQRPEALILVMDDMKAKQVLVAWSLYGAKFKETPARKNESDHERLARYWEEVNPDMNRIAMIAGMPVTRVTRIFNRLCAAFLIWPDGTIGSDALGIIIGARNAYVRLLMPKQPKDEKEKTDDGKRSLDADKKAPRKNGGANSGAKARGRAA